MTEYEFVLMLDSDVAVVRNLDHILDRSLERGTSEVRTPKGCQGSSTLTLLLRTYVLLHFSDLQYTRLRTATMVFCVHVLRSMVA